jgi:aspartyl-tRNA(Asn)/glutamyl-tRNA(Gln) amidotransferase subunit A
MHTKSIKEIIDYVQGDASRAAAVGEALFLRATSIDAKIGAYLDLQKERVSEAFASLPSGTRFYGLPVSLKDNMCTRGWETTCASNILTGFIPPYNATVVEKLHAAGAYIFAKCDMDEFAFGSSCETSAYNRRVAKQKKLKNGPCVNPWDTERVPGGSSGGSAACVAADEAICSLGSDTGGSIRQPAALCGVVGLKPTYGRVSRYGLIAFGSSLDQIGPITKTVEDSALLLGIIAGYDPKDSTSANVPVPEYTASLGKDIKGLRIGIPKEYFIDGIDPEIRKVIDEAKKIYTDLGATLVDVTLPHTQYAVSVYYIIATAEASSNLARFDGVEYGYRYDEGTLHDMYFETRNRGFGAEAKRRILLGTFVLSSGYYDAYYKKAQKVRTLMVNDFDQAFKACDVILTPTSPTAAFKIGEKSNDPISMYLSDIFTIPANIAGIPGMAVPAGFTPGGLPVGMQLLAPAFKEEILFQFAHAFEQKTNVYKQRPKL